MPKMHLRSISSAIDPDEMELRERARAARLSVRFNGRSQHLGVPHVELFSKHQRNVPLAAFIRCADAIQWVDQMERER